MAPKLLKAITFTHLAQVIKLYINQRNYGNIDGLNFVGKRLCLGESLAKNTYFLFTTALFKKFRLEAIPNEPLPSLQPTNGLTLGYQGFKAVALPRT